MMRWSAVLFACAGFAVVGCDDGSADDGDADSSDTTEMMSRCAAEDRAEEFHLGLAKDGQAMRVTFTDAEPAEPTRGINTWRVALTDLDDAAVQDVELRVIPWMPDHGHGSPQPVEITDMGDGEFELTPVNLFMAGFWTVTLKAEDEEIVFNLCVE